MSPHLHLVDLLSGIAQVFCANALGAIYSAHKDNMLVLLAEDNADEGATTPNTYWRTLTLQVRAFLHS